MSEKSCHSAREFAARSCAGVGSGDHVSQRVHSITPSPHFPPFLYLSDGSKTNIPVIGVVENMSGFVCPCCATRSDIFKTSGDGPSGMAARAGVPFLGALPIDPHLLAACEAGEAYIVKYADSPAVKPFLEIVAKIEKSCGHVQRQDS